MTLGSSVDSECRRYCCRVPPNGYTDDELAAMMADLESDLVERKLTPADGAIGGHTKAVQDCYWDFRHLACAVASRCGVTCPQL